MEQFDGLTCYDEGVHSRYRKIRSAITTTVANFVAQRSVAHWQIMDLGCGEGQALTEVAIALQQQSLITFNGVGIDLFAQNITHAQQQNTMPQLQFTNESFFNFARCLQALPQTPQQAPTMIISSGGLSNAILQDHELLYLLQLAYQHNIVYLVLASIRSVHVPTPLLQRVGYDVTYHNFPNLIYPVYELRRINETDLCNRFQEQVNSGPNVHHVNLMYCSSVPTLLASITSAQRRQIRSLDLSCTNTTSEELAQLDTTLLAQFPALTWVSCEQVFGGKQNPYVAIRYENAAWCVASPRYWHFGENYGIDFTSRLLCYVADFITPTNSFCAYVSDTPVQHLLPPIKFSERYVVAQFPKLITGNSAQQAALQMVREIPAFIDFTTGQRGYLLPILQSLSDLSPILHCLLAFIYFDGYTQEVAEPASSNTAIDDDNDASSNDFSGYIGVGICALQEADHAIRVYQTMYAQGALTPALFQATLRARDIDCSRRLRSIDPEHSAEELARYTHTKTAIELIESSLAQC